MTPAEVLDDVKGIVTGPRNDTHGDYAECLEAIARFWTLFLTTKGTNLLTGADVADMMSLLKISRPLTGQDHPDHDLDNVGYAAIKAALKRRYAAASDGRE